MLVWESAHRRPREIQKVKFKTSMEGHLTSGSVPDIMFVFSSKYIDMLNLPFLPVLAVELHLKCVIPKVLGQCLFSSAFSNKIFANKL